MKRFLLIALMAITAVAVVTAPGWAAGGRKLSDRQLSGIYAGADADADADAAAKAKARSSSSTSSSGGASTSAETSSDVQSVLAVKIDNQCSTENCKLKVETEAEGASSTVNTNAQSIANTLASVNAIQVNVSAGGGTQVNKAYSAEGVIGEIDSAEFAVGIAAGTARGDGAASSASEASDAIAGGAGNSTVTITGTTTHTNGNSTQTTTVTANPNSDADAAAASTASSAATSASSTSASTSARTSASAASALAFATPKVKIINRCNAGNCKLKVETEAENGGTVTTNAQSILNTVASVNAVQINVSGSGTATQTNTAYSTLK